MSQPALTAVPAPDPRVLALWLVDLSQAPSPAALAVLDEAERERAARFRFARDARRYRASHVALRQLLGDALGAPAQAVHISAGMHGKPFLPKEAGLHFNLSHSGDWALIGLSRERPLGVDLEDAEPMDDIPALMQRNFTASEQDSYVCLPPEDRLNGFLRGWTRKEACLKALGSGLLIEPHVFDAGLEPARRHTFVPADGRRWDMAVCSVELPVRALAAVAVLERPQAPEGW